MEDELDCPGLTPRKKTFPNYKPDISGYDPNDLKSRPLFMSGREIKKYQRHEDAIRARLKEYYTDMQADKWLHLPHPQLENQRPYDLIFSGRKKEVEAVLDRLDGDGYI